MPAQAGEMRDVRSSEMPVTVKSDGSFVGEVEVPANVDVAVYRITGTNSHKLFEQVIRLNIGQIQDGSNP